MLRVEEELLAIVLLADWVILVVAFSVTGDVADSDLLKSVKAVGEVLNVDVSCCVWQATTRAAGNNRPLVWTVQETSNPTTT